MSFAWDTPLEARPPFALVEPSEGAMRLSAVNGSAAMQGLRPGLALAQARAMLPALAIADHDRAADARLLARIADWADRYTPLVGRTPSPSDLLRHAGVPDRKSPPNTLLLDLTGAAHLQGGEASLLADIIRRLDRQGFTVRAAIAATPGAAHALACFGQHRTIGMVAETHRLLAPLPVAALRLDSEMVAALRRVGLKTIGDLASRPRAPLTARFGPLLLRRLDQALGIDEEAINPRQPVPPAIVDLPLAEPIFREEDIAEAIGHLLDRLCAMLGERGQGARALELAIYRVDGAVNRLAIRSAIPSRDAVLLQRLFALRLQSLADPLDAGFGFDHVRIAATAVAPFQTDNLTLAGIAADADAPPDVGAASRLADKLAARFGADRVLSITRADTHIPERAAVLRPRDGQPGTPATASLATASLETSSATAPPRPLRLFPSPEAVEIIAAVPDGPPLRLRWRRRSLRIVAAEGPERIAPEWWSVISPGELLRCSAPDRSSSPDELLRCSAPDRTSRDASLDDATRDYYRVADETGRQLWLFRAGLYPRSGASASATDPPASAPRWFVHGLFA